jgi:hypothetical protein
LRLYAGIPRSGGFLIRVHRALRQYFLTQEASSPGFLPETLSDGIRIPRNAPAVGSCGIHFEALQSKCDLIRLSGHASCDAIPGFAVVHNPKCLE